MRLLVRGNPDWDILRLSDNGHTGHPFGGRDVRTSALRCSATLLVGWLSNVTENREEAECKRKWGKIRSIHHEKREKMHAFVASREEQDTRSLYQLEECTTVE